MTDFTADSPVATPPRRRRRFSPMRILTGGQLGDLGRLPRYLAFALLGGALIWAPITGYLRTAPLSFKSSASLILPGSGASASMNLNGIGQASSFANSAFASNSVSPTETYKRLIGADRILDATARSLDTDPRALGKPRIELVDQTSLIHVEMTGGTPEEAQARADALLAAFFAELDALRADEMATRQDSGLSAIADYRASVTATRADIATLQQETGLVSGDQYDALVERNDALKAQVQDLAADLSEKRRATETLAATLGLPAGDAAATLKLFADTEYLALTDEVSTTGAELSAAAARFGSRHPKVEKARSAQDSARAAALARAARVTGLPVARLSGLDLAPSGARAELLAQLVRMDSERAGIAAEYATLSDRLGAESTALAAMAPAAARLEDMQRDFTVAEAVFASAIARTQSTKSDVYASYPLVQVLENPSRPDSPSSPNRKLAIAAGGAATLMLLIGLLLGWVRLALIGRLLNAPQAA